MSYEGGVRGRLRPLWICPRGLSRRLFRVTRVMFRVFILRMCLGRLISRLRLRLRGSLMGLGLRRMRFLRES